MRQFYVNDTISVEDLFAQEYYLDTLQMKYNQYELAEPGWIQEQLTEVKEEIKKRLRGDTLRKLQLARAKRALLQDKILTPDEKLSIMDKEIELLEKRLA